MTDETGSRCPHCGGELIFDISHQKLMCEHCETEGEVASRPVVEHDFSPSRTRDADASWNQRVESFRCSSCGAEILVEGSVTSLVCSYCGSSHVLREKQSAGIAPEAIVLFKVDKHRAAQVFNQWVRKRFWAPSALRTLVQTDALNAVYLPYWTFDAQADCPYRAQGGRVYYVRVGSGKEARTVRRVRWFSVRGRIRHFFDDVLVSARKIRDKLVSKVERGDVKDCKAFDMSYLAGYSAEKYDADPQQSFEQARQIMCAELESMAAGEVLRSYDEVQGVQISPEFFEVKFKHLLLPFWRGAFHYRDKLYRVVINGQSSAIKGEYPKSKLKIALFAALSLIVLAVIVYLLAVSGVFESSRSF